MVFGWPCRAIDAGLGDHRLGQAGGFVDRRGGHSTGVGSGIPKTIGPALALASARAATTSEAVGGGGPSSIIARRAMFHMKTRRDDHAGADDHGVEPRIALVLDAERGAQRLVQHRLVGPEASTAVSGSSPSAWA